MAIKAKKVQPVKTAAISEIKGQLDAVSDYIFTEYRGLTVEQITNLRGQLREKGCSYRVVKNNYARIAFKDLEKSDVSNYLVGPTAIALTSEEANAVAKILFDFSKEAPALIIKGALIDGEVYDAAKIEAFSKLPGKKDLIAMLMSAMNATTSKLARTLQAVADQKAAGGTEKASAPVSEPAPAKEAAAKEEPVKAEPAPAKEEASPETAKEEPVKAEAAPANEEPAPAETAAAEPAETSAPEAAAPEAPADAEAPAEAPASEEEEK
ncbi:50S ribosomal protein L10 [Brucepastera parasyntrophica]|uniref:50S ribosomal protein L10 n=1 Tax=Brucepastera parasyntrophica TaxID=2880008 RepID=UPI00210B0302|nr:50S ribosomal protein L10 [Brucepastera parasyntrophica]ULQ59305.1 50S ribosomal protein L10 [Brucepastera parasyntrophica]